MLLATSSAGVGALLRRQIRQAHRAIGALAAGESWPAAARGVEVGTEQAPRLRLVLLGDSSGVGLGARRPEDTLGHRLLSRLASAGYGARLDVVAVSGADARDLAGQVEEALVLAPHVAVVSVGGNDVTHRLRPRAAGRLLGDAVARLRTGGAQVVVATCPDLGAVRRLGRPLRWWAGVASRREWRSQRAAASRAGAVVVGVGRQLGPAFARDAGMFSADGFHPSSTGYAALADTLWPAVLAAAERQCGPR